MGAFYQTTSPTEVDYGYKLPTQLIAQVIQNADAQNDAQLNQLDILDDTMAKVQFLNQDRERTKEILAGYGTQTNDLVSELYNNPQDVRKRMGTIRTLGRKLKADYTSGELAAIMGNKSEYYAWLKGEQERMAKGEITPQMLAAAQSKYLRDFKGTGYDPETGNFNRISTSPLAKYVNLEAKFKEYLKDVEKNIVETKYDDVSGRTLYKTIVHNRDEWRDAEGLKQIARDAFNADLEAQASVNQLAQLGLVKDPNAYIQSAMDAAVDPKAVLNTLRELTHEGDTVKMQLQQQEETRANQRRQWAHEAQVKAAEAQENFEKEKRAALFDLHKMQVKNNIDHSDDPSKQVEVSPNPYGPPQPSGLTDEVLSVYTGEELKVENLRTSVKDIQGSIAETKKQLAEAQKNGDTVIANGLKQDLTTQEGLLKTTQGILTQARLEYYKSDEFKGLSPEMQDHVRSYMIHLVANNKDDTPQERAAFARTRGLDVLEGIRYTDPATGRPIETPADPRIGYGNPLNPNIRYTGFRGEELGKPDTSGIRYTDPFRGGAISSRKSVAFNNALDNAVGTMNKSARNTGVSNVYNAKGVALNMSDASMYQALNDMFKYSNTVTYQPGTYGGTTATGQPRGQVPLKLDVDKWGGLRSTEGAFDINSLVAATGAGQASAVIDKAIALPTTNGNVRLKLTLKTKAPDGGTIGNGAFDKYQVEGLNDNNEVIVEVVGSGASQGFVNRLRTDADAGVRTTSYILTDPNLANLRDKYLRAMAPPPGNVGWGQPSPFSYGNVGYEVRRNSSGAAEINYKVGGNEYIIQYPDTHTAEEELMHMSDALDSGDPNLTSQAIRILKANAKRSGK